MNYARKVNRRPSNDRILVATVAMVKNCGECDPIIIGIVSGAIDFTLDQVDVHDAIFDKELCRNVHSFLYEVWKDHSWTEPYLWRGMDDAIGILRAGKDIRI